MLGHGAHGTRHVSEFRTAFRAELPLAGSADSAFDTASQEIQNWLDLRVKHLSQGRLALERSFDQGVRNIALGHNSFLRTVRLDEMRLWSSRLEHPDQPGSKGAWRVDATLGRDPSGRFTCASLTLSVKDGSNGQTPELQSYTKILRQLARRPGIVDAGHSVGQIMEAVSIADAERLLNLIVNPRRRLPLILTTTGERGQRLLDANKLIAAGLGIAHIAGASAAVTRILTDNLGRDYSCWEGGARLYVPAFNPESSEPRFNPIQSYRHADAEAINQSISRFIETALRTVTRTANPDMPRHDDIMRIAEAANSDRAGPDKTSLELRNEELTLLNRSLTMELDKERQEVIRLSKLVADNERQISKLLTRQPLQRPRQPDDTESGLNQIPLELCDVPKWIKKHLGDSIVMTPRALKEMKQATYQDLSKLCGALALLANQYRSMRDQTGTKAVYDNTRKALYLVESPCFQNPGAAAAYGEAYYVNHDGNRRYLDRVLKHGNARDQRHCLRIYFFWDENRRRAVIGSMPAHLRSKAT